jgi:hypothetical protein
MTLATKADFLTFINRNKTQIKSYGVHRLGLFGSFVRNEQKEKSDIDLLVEFYPEEKNYDNFIGLSFFLEDNTDRKVDILTPEALSPYIGPYILKEVEYYEI